VTEGAHDDPAGRQRLLLSELAAMDDLVEQGRWDRVTTTAGRVLALAGATGDPGIRLQAHYQRARALALGGHAAAALLDSGRAGELADQLGEPAVEAQMWLGVAETLHRERQFPQAVEAYERALAARQKRGDGGPEPNATTGLDDARRMVHERDRLVGGLRSRLEQINAAPVSASAFGPDAMAEAAALRELACGWPPDMEARYMLGAFHWARRALMPGDGTEDLAAAVTLLGPLHDAPREMVPEDVRQLLDQLHEWGQRGIELAMAAEDNGDTEALAEAEQLLRRVLSVTDPDDLARPERLSNLGVARLTRFELASDMAALEDSISLGREAVRRTPATHPSRPIYLTNLGNSLQAMHDATGDAEALAETVEASRAAFLASDPLAPRYAGLLSNLSAALGERHATMGDPAALEEAIESGRDAVLLAWPDDPGLPGYRSNLASALVARHNLAGDVDSLREAVAVLRLAAATADAGATHEQAALDQASRAAREAVAQLPESHPERQALLSDLTHPPISES
jgi:tetratricopeptide (TPR) repeat protein